ncbi:MAG: phosphatidylglycerol lysyltransferase domain-containing protein [Treponema sp.]|jgi:hypothetical protein|nr:phosphatidylglycerol lysyltransferase domain-containing protein [Treponema sp.]
MDTQKRRNLFLAHGFLPIDAGSYPLYRQYAENGRLQEKSAVIISVWSGSNQGLYRIIRGVLCSVFFFDHRDPYFVLHGEEGADALEPVIDELYGLAEEAAFSRFRIECIDESVLSGYTLIDGYAKRVEYLEKDNEYVYQTKELLNLDGRHNYKKRSFYRKFSQMADLSIVPMTRDNIGLSGEVEKAWCSSHDCAYCRSFYGCEKEALNRMAGIFDEKRHGGLVAFKGDKPAGYIIGENMNSGLAFLYFGKGTIPQLYAYLIYVCFNRYLQADRINLSDDLGMEGLRTFKRELSRYEQWHRYSISYTRKSA